MLQRDGRTKEPAVSAASVAVVAAEAGDVATEVFVMVAKTAEEVGKGHWRLSVNLAKPDQFSGEVIWNAGKIQ